MTCAAETVWRRSPVNYELGSDEVHVWRAKLGLPQDSITGLLRILSPAEREKAARFHFEADRKRAIIGRGMARVLLGQCLGRPPDQLQFEYNAFGKPTLAGGFDGLMKFSVSHAGDLILVALARGRELGVDVEHMRADFASDQIAARFFSRNERRALAAVAPELQCDAFFSCWTRKEAYLKARGDGLSLALDQFDVTLAPAEDPRLLETRHDPADAQRWALHAFDPGHGCKAAVAVEGPPCKLICWDWHGIGAQPGFAADARTQPGAPG